MITTRTAKPPMDPTRKAALYAGLFYIGTFVFSIPALGLYDGVVNDPNFVLGAGSDQGVLWGALIEILTALTGIGTAVALYSVIKRYGPGRAVGFVASRTLEAAAIFAGVLAVLGVYTLRQDFAGATDAAALTTTAGGLVAVKDWSFLLGPGIMPAINALCFATIMYQSRLVPRWIPTVGLIGAPLLLASSTASLFGAWDQVSAAGMLMALPIATWEFSVGVYMTVKGFRTPPATDADASVVPAPAAVLATPDPIDRDLRRHQALRARCGRRPPQLRGATRRAHRLLGPNGAGESTTMRMVVGLDAPTSGLWPRGGRPRGGAGREGPGRRGRRR